MSKKQIRNRLDKLFDEIKEEESATKEQAAKTKRSRRRGAPKRRSPIKRTGVLVLKPEPESTTIAEMQTDVQTDIAGSLSVMSLPLRVDEQSWATLQVIDDSAPREWNPEEQMLVQQVADQLSLALENARLFQETQEHAEELVVLNEMGRALASTLDVQGVAETVYRYVSRLTNTTNFYIALYDKAKDEVDFLLLYDRGRAIRGQTRKSGAGLAEYVVRTCEPLLMRENVARQVKTLGIDLLGTIPKSWLGVPMVIGEHVVGVIAIQDYEQVNAYDQHTVSLFESIASQAAIAIQNARLFEETQRRNEELALVNRVVGTAATSLDLSQSLQIIANEIAASVSALHVGIALIDKDGTNLVLTADASASGSDQSDIGIVIPLANNPTAETVIAKGETLIINDVYHNPLAATIREIMKQRKTQSLYVLPLFSDKQVIGTVGIDFAEPDRQLDEKEMRLVKTVLLQASTSIERARLFQQMRESEARFRDVALSSADWVWEFDTQSRYSYCSDRAVDVLGYRPEEIIGKRVVEFMP